MRATLKLFRPGVALTFTVSWCEFQRGVLPKLHRATIVGYVKIEGQRESEGHAKIVSAWC